MGYGHLDAACTADGSANGFGGHPGCAPAWGRVVRARQHPLHLGPCQPTKLYSRLWPCPPNSFGAVRAEELLSDDNLLAFGSDAEAAAAAAARRAATAAASSSAAAAAAADGFVPRKRRAQKQLPLSALPKVAVVGRPNVGKSAMFNRIAGSSVAVVFDYPGVTRDRIYTRAFWGDKEFVMIDTGEWARRLGGVGWRWAGGARA
jgi:hypothetical protein